MMSVPSAFQQLVSFVRQLPSRVKDEKAAAHLKTFEARKVDICQQIVCVQHQLCGNAMYNCTISMPPVAMQPGYRPLYMQYVRHKHQHTASSA